jgi:hypothetical protein
MKKLFLIALITLFALSTKFVLAQANFVSIRGEDLKLEKTNNQIPFEYTIPKSILVVPIAQPNIDNEIDPLDWYRGIYYYQTTRYAIPSISFHYVITNDGKLIEFDVGNIDRKISFVDSTIDSPLVVGYFTTPGATRFNPYAREQVEEIILYLANKNAIPLDQIYVKSLLFSQGEDRLLNMNVSDIFVGWQTDLDKIKENIQERYLPVERTYSVTIGEPQVPDAPNEIDSIIEVGLRITNDGEFPIYKDSGGLFLTRKGADTSGYFINNVWASQTQVELENEGATVLRPSESLEYKFQIKVPFTVGKASEVFDVRTIDGDIISKNDITIELDVARPDKEIIEITDTGAGYLRVRKGAGINFEELTRVSTGEKFFVLRRENGWVEINTGEGQTGWVAGQYTKLL